MYRATGICLQAVLVSAAACPAVEDHVRRFGHFTGALGLRHAVAIDAPSGSSCSGEVPLTVVPDVIARSGDEVEVNWPAGTFHDEWIGLYLSAVAAHSEWVDFFGANQTPPVHTSLINLRQGYELRYFRDGACRGRSRPVRFALGMLEPVGGHIALSGRSADDTGLVVSWQSGSSDPEPFVEWGLTSGSYTHRAGGTSTSYSAGDMCDSPANLTQARRFLPAGFFHHALLDDLPAGQPVFYRFGQGAAVSSERRFRAPAPASQRFSFVALADMGVSGHWDGFKSGKQDPGVHDVLAEVAGRLLATRGSGEEPRFVLHFGDLAYAVGVGFVWELWQQQIEEVAASVPYMLSIGNHEYDHQHGGEKDPSHTPGQGFHPRWGPAAPGRDSAGECGVPFVHRFPAAPPTGFGSWWYAFAYGSAYFVMLSSEHDFLPGSTQYRWLDETLAAVNRTRHPWVIVTSHRPAYNSEDWPGQWNVSVQVARALDPLLLRHRVALFMAGHYHVYERTCAVSGRACRSGAPVHVTVGTAGTGLHLFPPKPRPEAPWRLKTVYTYGYLDVHVSPEQLHLRFHGGMERPFSVLDEATIPRAGVVEEVIV